MTKTDNSRNIQRITGISESNNGFVKLFNKHPLLNPEPYMEEGL